MKDALPRIPANGAPGRAVAVFLAACAAFFGAAFFGACAAPHQDAATHELSGDSTPTAPSIDRVPPARAADPTRYLVETDIFELPLPIAEDLYGRADERGATIGTFPDEAKCHAALALLAPANPAIAHCQRASRVLEIGQLEPILPRELSSTSQADATKPSGAPFASDALGLQVRITRSDGWPPLQLETQVHWKDPQGRVLGQLPSATSPLPDGYWMEIVCLPAKSEAASSKTPAIFAFLRVTPLAERYDSVPTAR